MVPQGDEAQVEAHFSTFGDSANLDARKVHGLCQMNHRLRNCFGVTPMVLLGDKAQVEAHFGLFGDSANLDARLVHALRRTYHRLRNHFGCT